MVMSGNVAVTTDSRRRAHQRMMSRASWGRRPTATGASAASWAGRSEASSSAVGRRPKRRMNWWITGWSATGGGVGVMPSPRRHDTTTPLFDATDPSGGPPPLSSLVSPKPHRLCRAGSVLAQPCVPPTSGGAGEPGVLHHLGELGSADLPDAARAQQHGRVAVEVWGREERGGRVLDQRELVAL